MSHALQSVAHRFKCRRPPPTRPHAADSGIEGCGGGGGDDDDDDDDDNNNDDDDDDDDDTHARTHLAAPAQEQSPLDREMIVRGTDAAAAAADVDADGVAAAAAADPS